MPNNLMNRFGTRQMPQAPIAPLQQRPGMFEQIGTTAATAVGTDFAKDQMKEGLGAVKDNIGFMFGPDAATAGMAEAIGGGAATGAGSQAAMLAAQNAGLEGAAGLTAEALGAGTAATEAAVAGATEAGLAGGAGALGGLGASAAAAMPWVGAGLLAGKAFGLFSKGGPVEYASCGKKMYRAEGGDVYSKYTDGTYSNPYNQDPNEKYYGYGPKTQGVLKSFAADANAESDPYEGFGRKIEPWEKDKPWEGEDGGQSMMGLLIDKTFNQMTGRDPGSYTYTWGDFANANQYLSEGGGTSWWDSIKKSFTEKPEWENYKAVQVPVLDGSGNPTNMTSTVYRPSTQANDLEKAIARDIYGEYDDGEDMGDASYLAGDPAPYSVQTYPLERRSEIQMKSNTPPKGGPLLRKFGAPGIRRDPQEFNRDLNEYSIKRNKRLNPQPDDGSGIWEDMKGFFRSNGDDADVSGFNMGGRVGPLKSTQYKSAGGEVYTESYYNSSEK